MSATPARSPIGSPREPNRRIPSLSVEDRGRSESVFAVRSLEDSVKVDRLGGSLTRSSLQSRRSSSPSPPARTSIDEVRKQSQRTSVAFGVSQSTQEALKCMKSIRSTLAELRVHFEQTDTKATRLTNKLVELVNRLGCGLVLGEGFGGTRASAAHNLQDALGRTDTASDAEKGKSPSLRPLLEDTPILQSSAQLQAAAFYSVMEGMLRELTAERASLYLYDRNRDGPGHAMLVTAVTVGRAMNGKPIPPQKVSPTAGLLGQVFQTGLIINIVDAATVSDEVFNRFVDQRTGLNTRNTLCAPVRRCFRRLAPDEQAPEDKASNPKDFVGVLEFLNKLPPVVKHAGSEQATPSHFTATDEAKAAQYSKLLSVMLDMFGSNVPTLMGQGPQMQGYIAANTSEGPHCVYAQNTGQGLSHTEERRRKEHARRLAQRYAARVETEDPWEPESEGAKQRRRLDEEALVYRTEEVLDDTTGYVLPARRAAKVTESAGSLREVQLYVERLEECWKNARRRNVELEAVIEKLKRREPGKADAPASADGPPMEGEEADDTGDGDGRVDDCHAAGVPAADKRTPSDPLLPSPPQLGKSAHGTTTNAGATLATQKATPQRLAPHVRKNVMAYFQQQLRGLLARHKVEQQALLERQEEEAASLREGQLLQLEHQQVSSEACAPPWMEDPSKVAAMGNRVCANADIPSLWHVPREPSVAKPTALSSPPSRYKKRPASVRQRHV